jgi:hypothetical protein
MTTDIVYTTVNLPPAFLGMAYEAAIAYKAAASAVTAQGATAGTNTTGLPAGLALDTNASAPGSLRITGTPTGAASTPQGSGVATSGPGAYTFAVTATDSGGAVVSSAYTINVYSSFTDPNLRAGESVATQATEREATDQ